MPGIFSRRRGSTGQVHSDRPPSSAAAVAASAAFLNQSPSHASLSSAAAAAALRSHVTTPEPVGNVQTKRMVRRGSNSSNASGIAPNALGQRPIVRRTSQGSMTERSFRSSSPGLAPSPQRDTIPAAPDAPPVPPLPTQRLPTRSASAEPSTSGRRRPDPVKVHVPSGLHRPQDVEREGSRNSVNFSRPIASPAPTDTPPVSPTRSKTGGSWFASPTETGVSPRQSVHDRHSTTAVASGTKSGNKSEPQTIARAPSKGKRKAARNNEGARLASGSMSPGPVGTEVAKHDSLQDGRAAGTKSPTHGGPRKRQSDPDNLNTDESVKERATPSEQAATRRPTYTLSKQPSVVMEEVESGNNRQGHNPRESPFPALGSKRSPQQVRLSPRPRQSSATSTNSSATSPQLRSRPHSLEVPESQKSAHFSNNLIDASSGIRHDPPGRSVSPVKSALKHSPSSSIRTSSPVATFSPANRNPGSDTSDTLSMTSQDGPKAAQNRKKAARVSFDEDAIGMIAEQNTESKTNGVKKNTRRSFGATLSDDDLDDVKMQPRPALPSFGSVRKSKPRNDRPSTAEKVTETLSGKQNRLQERSAGTSSDLATAGVVHGAHGKAREDDQDVPVPPEVTSVEGSGQLSDSVETSDEEELVKGPITATAESDNVEGSKQLSNKTRTADHLLPKGHESENVVPDIQVLPATPGTEEPTRELDGDHGKEEHVTNNEEDLEASIISIPGSWGDEDEETPIGPTALSKDQQQNGAVDSALPRTEHVEDSDSDESAAFSDAAEDPSELEPFGYASMDAIVESPVPPTSAEKKSKILAKPDSSPETETPTVDDKDWSNASAYWSSKKQPVRSGETEKRSHLPAAALGKSDTNQPKQKAKKARQKASLEQAAAAAPSRATGSASQQGRHLRGSMRASTNQPVQERPTAFRKTMRGPTPPAVRNPPADGGQGNARSALQYKTMRSTPSARSPSSPKPSQVQKPMASPLAPAVDSDSESSFRRKPRRPAVDTRERYTMKRSLRDGSLDLDRGRKTSSSQAATASSKWSLRSLSPAPETAAMNRNAFRPSLRGTAIPEGPTLRGQNSIAQRKQPKPSGKFSMSGFSKAPRVQPPAGSSSGKKGFQSRFADSDSETETPLTPSLLGLKPKLRSHRTDSDDDDSRLNFIPADLTPVRGIPRPKNVPEEDSTDLDDSSDDEFSRRRRAKRADNRSIVAKPIIPSQADIDRAMATARQNVAAMTGNQNLLEPQTPQNNTPKPSALRTGIPPAPTAETASVSPSTNAASPVARRRGLLGSIFGRRGSTSSVTSLGTNSLAGTAEMTPPGSPSTIRGKLQRKHTPRLVRNNSAQSNISTISRSSKTSKLAAPVGIASPNPDRGAMPALKEDEEDESTWPLEPPPKIPAAVAESSRPASSDGVTDSARRKVETERPPLGRRTRSGGGMDVYSERTGKKKRFGRLRRAFGLED